MQSDVNADMGESFGLYRIGNDAEFMRFISSTLKRSYAKTRNANTNGSFTDSGIKLGTELTCIEEEGRK